MDMVAGPDFVYASGGNLQPVARESQNMQEIITLQSVIPEATNATGFFRVGATRRN